MNKRKEQKKIAAVCPYNHSSVHYKNYQIRPTFFINASTINGNKRNLYGAITALELLWFGISLR